MSDLLELAKQLTALSSEEKKMLDKILNEPQIEARSVKENEQTKEFCHLSCVGGSIYCAEIGEKCNKCRFWHK